MDGRKLFIGGIHHAEKEEVKAFFSKFGPIMDPWIARNPTGFGYVTFDREEDASAALREADGQMIGDEKIRVEVARPRRPREERGYSRRSRSGSRNDRRRRSRSRSNDRRRRHDSRSRSRSHRSHRRDSYSERKERTSSRRHASRSSSPRAHRERSESSGRN